VIRIEALAGLILLLACVSVWAFAVRAAARRKVRFARPLIDSLGARLVLFPGQIGTVGFQWERQGVRFLLKYGFTRASLRATPLQDGAFSELRLRWGWDGRQVSIQVIDREDVRLGELVNERVRQNLEMLSRLSPPSGGTVEVGLRDVVLRRLGGLPDDSQVTLFANLAVPIALRLMRACRVRGVEVLESGATGEGTCLVCGHALHEDVVRCAACRAPHHRECWVYIGACATFACGGRESTSDPAAAEV
jgi:hypothetical protein